MNSSGVRPRVCVVGGGLAGLSAAVTAMDGGASVTLVEARGRLGGATYSFDRDGLVLDNGQHVFLRCCTAYQKFLNRLHVTDRVSIQPRLSIPVRSPDGRSATLRRGNLPAPAQLAASLLRYPFLTGGDKVRAVRALLALRGVDPEDPATDQQSFGRWLRAHGQSDRAIDALWALIGVATLNVAPDECSLAPAAMVFRTGLLGAVDAADIGTSLVPLSRLHADPAAAVLRAGGADIRTGVRVRGVRPTGSGYAVLSRAGTIAADAVILAVPHDAVAPLLPPGAGADVERFVGLGHSPIVDLHVVYDRMVCEEPFTTTVGSPAQWVFDRSRAAGLADGQYLAVSLSAADDYLRQSVEQLRATFLPALADLFRPARNATVRRFLVTREPHATFRAIPGTGALRSPDETGSVGVLLAGAWTDTGWPATMEGAVRSGVRAARSALRGTPTAATEPPPESGTTDRRPEGALL